MGIPPTFLANIEGGYILTSYTESLCLKPFVVMRKQVKHPRKLSDCFRGGASTKEKTCITSKPKSLPCTSPPLTIRGLSDAKHKLVQSGVTTRRPTTETLWLRCLQQRIVCDAEVLDVLLHKLFCPHQLFSGQMAK